MDQIGKFLSPSPADLHSKGRKDRPGGEGSKKNSGPNSERAELIGYFTDRINKERRGTKWKPVTPRYIAVKLSHIKGMSDLYYLKSCGEDYADRHGSFSKYFFGALKVRSSDA